MQRLEDYDPIEEEGKASGSTGLQARRGIKAQVDKRMVVALLFAVLAVLGYFGWHRFLRSSGESGGRRGNGQAQVQDARIAYRLDVQPAGASVTLTHDRLGLILEQKVAGQVLTLDLEPGTYHALVTCPGFRTVQQDIEVNQSQTSWPFKLSECRGDLAVMSNPGVSVSVAGPDGKAVPLGETDARGRLTIRTLCEGDHQLALSLTDHRSETVNISLTEGGATEVKKQLEPLPGRLKLDGLAGLAVYDAGRRLGQANEWME